jgi:hypothetical protein
LPEDADSTFALFKTASAVCGFGDWPNIIVAVSIKTNIVDKILRNIFSPFLMTKYNISGEKYLPE